MQILAREPRDNQSLAVPEIVAPAFSSLTHALLFALLTVGICLLPLALGLLKPQKPATIFKSIPPSYGSYYNIGVNFAETKRIDVVIVGTSVAWNGLDSRIIADRLTEAVGEKVIVRNFATNSRGEDRSAEIIRHVVRKYKPKLVLAGEVQVPIDAPHPLSKYWNRGDIDVSQFGIVTAAQFYTMRVLGAPRQIWSRIRSKHFTILNKKDRNHVRRLRKSFGFSSKPRGWRSNFAPAGTKALPMPDERYVPPPLPVDSLFYREGVSDNFVEDSSMPYEELQTYFFEYMRDEVRKRGGTFASVGFPVGLGENEDISVQVAKLHLRPLADGKKKDWPVLGIPLARIFPGMPMDEVKNFFANETHFNPSGARVFTLALMPSIEKLYREAIAR
jgi:hypothetical protein